MCERNVRICIERRLSASSPRTCDGRSYSSTICNIDSFAWDVMDTALDAISVKERHIIKINLTGPFVGSRAMLGLPLCSFTRHSATSLYRISLSVPRSRLAFINESLCR